MRNSDNDKQEGSVAFVLTTLMKKSTFNNGEIRAILPETKRFTVRVTRGICGMVTYNLL